MKRPQSPVLILIVTFAVAPVLFAARANAQELRIVIPAPVTMMESNFNKMIEDFSAALGEASGYEIDFNLVPYEIGEEETELVFEAFDEGEADIGLFAGSLLYVLNRDKWNLDLVPTFTLMFNNSISSQECFYVREDDPAESIGDIAGKTWGGSTTLPSRLLLHEAGINKPLAEFFGEARFVQDQPLSILVELLAEKEIDVFTANKHHLMMGGAAAPAGGQEQSAPSFRELECTGGELSWLFVTPPDMPEKMRNKITYIVMNAHKNSAFNKFRFMFIAIKGHFRRFEEGDLEHTEEIAALAKKHGWLDEYKKHRAALERDD